MKMLLAGLAQTVIKGIDIVEEIKQAKRECTFGKKVLLGNRNSIVCTNKEVDYNMKICPFSGIFKGQRPCDCSSFEDGVNQPPSYDINDSINFNPYEVLGLSNGASEKEIKARYRELSKIFHPDTNSGNDKKFKEIQHAYEILSKANKA